MKENEQARPGKVETTEGPVVTGDFERVEPAFDDEEPATTSAAPKPRVRPSASAALQARIDQLEQELATTRAERDQAKAATVNTPAVTTDPKDWPHWLVSLRNGPTCVVKAPDEANAWPAFCKATGLLEKGAENPYSATRTEKPVGMVVPEFR